VVPAMLKRMNSPRAPSALNARYVCSVKPLLFFPLWRQVRRRLLGMGRVEFEELRPGGPARRLAPGGHEGSQRGIGRHHQSASVAGRQGARLAGAVLLVALAQFPARRPALVQGPAGVVQGRRLRHGFKGADKKPVAHPHHLRTARTPKHPRAVIGRFVAGKFADDLLGLDLDLERRRSGRATGRRGCQRTSQRFSEHFGVGLRVVHSSLSGKEHVADAGAIFLRLVERGPVAILRRIENHDVGAIAGAKVAPLRNPEDIGRQSRSAADRLGQRQDLLFDCIVADLAGEGAEVPRVVVLVGIDRPRGAVGSRCHPGQCHREPHVGLRHRMADDLRVLLGHDLQYQVHRLDLLVVGDLLEALAA
jgi:hypothetical protein